MSDHPEYPERLASRALAFLPTACADPPSVSEILGQAENALDVLEWAVLPAEKGSPDVWRASLLLMWPRVCELEKPDAGPCEYVIWLQRKMSLETWHYENRNLSPDEQEEAMGARWAIGVGVQLGEDPLFEYHRLLKILSALAPDAPACLDVSSCLMQPGAWLRETAQSNIPPHPRVLFSIHSVNAPEDPAGPLWLHTHGLLRCGAVEYEMLSVPPDLLPQAVELMEVIAIGAIEKGSGAPGVPFSPGEGMVLEWRPWPDAVRLFPNALGSHVDDRDDYHHLPSGVILEKSQGALFSRTVLPLETLRRIDGKTVFFISDMETGRMRLLARERFPLFQKAFERFGDSEGWQFLIKCAFPFRAGDHDSFEHLWFRCSGLREAQALGELMNQPLSLTDMRPGMKDWIDLSQMSDWQIHTPRRHFDPDSMPGFDWDLA